MDDTIEDVDLWWFRELYFIPAAFADEPGNTISRIGEGRISLPDDQANDLAHFRECVLAKYPQAAHLQVMVVVAAIALILDSRSPRSESFQPWFWTNEGFASHHDWAETRSIARGFLLRPWGGDHG